jgi:N-acetylmuramic acid 6-phosphate etherase
MQASTVLMLVVGLALEYGRDFNKALNELGSWIQFLEKSGLGSLKDFVILEADTYAEGGYTCYSADEFAITVFTDTTERAPTFNLAPFDNPLHATDRRSLTYITLPSTKTSAEAWHHLLARDPRPLEWPDVHPKTSAEYLLSFDFSRNAITYRDKLLKTARSYEFAIENKGREMIFKFRGQEARFPLSGQNTLFDHLTLKMMLNMHSTLVLGRLGRFEGNLMTWLYPSNGKLVDRAARFTQILLGRKGLNFDYDSIVRAQFASKAELSPKESIVHKTIEKLTGNKLTFG